MTEFFQVVSLEEASQILKSNWPSPVAECVDLEHALGRTLVSEVVAAEEVPPFSRSTVDGYAVLASDVYGASEGLPAFLTLTGEIKMGSHPASGINSGECMWIPTGGMLPDGADAVVMVEHTERLDTDLILASRPVSLGENVIRIGEDCRIGDPVLLAGKVMRPQDLGVCAALGVTSLEVAAPLKVGVISTGDEIVSIDSNPGMGQVRDVNSYILVAALKQKGAIGHPYGIVPDDFSRLHDSVARALAENDMVMLSGGSSVGTRDLSMEVLLSFPDSELLFHGLSIKPGKPTLAVRIGGQLVIGLPGHPVSALMVFETLLGQMLTGIFTNRVIALLGDSVASQAGRDDFVRVRLEDKNNRYYAVPVYGKAGLIRVMSEADGFIHVPRLKQGIVKGEEVTVYLF